MDDAALAARLDSIEARLSAIEGAVGQRTPQPFPPAAASPSPWEQAARPVAPAPSYAYEMPKPGNWLGIIAVICFVLAGGFIIKLSIESGWLTPARQLGMATLLGLSLIGAGLWLLRTDREYAGLLPAAGVIVLYLVAFAGHRYYGLFSFEQALAMAGLVSALCIWLYMRIQHDLYAITAAVGSYLAPAVHGFPTSAEFSLYYFLLCSAAFAVISVWVRSRVLTLVSAYLAILLSGFIGMGLDQDGLMASVLATHFLIFAGGTYFHTRMTGQPLTEREAWSFFPILLVFYTMEYYFIEQVSPAMAPWISLGFAGVLIGLYLSARKYFPDGLGSQALILAFATLAAFHSAYIKLLPDDARAWVFVPIMLGAAFLPTGISMPRRGPLWIPGMALLAILAIEYLRMVEHLANGHDLGYWLFVSAAAFASIWFTLLRTQATSRQETYGHALLASAHLLAILGLYQLTEDIGSLAISGSWLFYGLGVIAFAFQRKDVVMARSALFVLAFAAGKALLYDAASAPTIVRILCLLLTGAVLYGCGLLMRKTSAWSARPD